MSDKTKQLVALTLLFVFGLCLMVGNYIRIERAAATSPKELPSDQRSH